MAYDENQQRISLDADSSIGVRTGIPGMTGSASPNGGKQYYFVKVTGEHTAGLVSVDGELAIGVLQNKPQRAGEAATVAISGVTLVTASAAISAGAQVAATATGKAVTQASTAITLGIALEDAAADGDLFAILLRTN